MLKGWISWHLHKQTTTRDVAPFPREPRRLDVDLRSRPVVKAREPSPRHLLLLHLSALQRLREFLAAPRVGQQPAQVEVGAQALARPRQGVPRARGRRVRQARARQRPARAAERRRGRPRGRRSVASQHGLHAEPSIPSSASLLPDLVPSSLPMPR